MSVQQLTVTTLQTKLINQEAFLLLDVREPQEFEYAHIPGSLLIPLQQIPQRLTELNPTQETLVICHHGMRSLQAAEYLSRAGFNKVFNVIGGIDAWSTTCDATVPRY